MPRKMTYTAKTTNISFDDWVRKQGSGNVAGPKKICEEVADSAIMSRNNPSTFREDMYVSALT